MGGCQATASVRPRAGAPAREGRRSGLIAVGCAVSSEQAYGAYAEPGIERSLPGARRLIRRRSRSIFAAYNSILDEVAGEPDLAAVLLIHEDVEIRDRGTARRLRECFAEGDVAIAGTIGGVGVTGVGWWQCDRGVGRARWSPPGWMSGVRLPPRLDFGAELDPAPADVDSLDGILLALSPWAARELRFDERLPPGFHGYDSDICFQARARGKRVRAIPVRVVHHTRGELKDRDGWRRAHAAFARKWGL